MQRHIWPWNGHDSMQNKCSSDNPVNHHPVGAFLLGGSISKKDSFAGFIVIFSFEVIKFNAQKIVRMSMKKEKTLYMPIIFH